MQLAYKILWIDDKIRNFIQDGEIEEVKNFIKDLGFKPEIITADNGDTISFQGYDLIITDFNLSAQNTGKQFIENIRSGEIFTEVLFYSENTELNTLAQGLYRDRLSFYSGVDAGLVSKIKQLIGLSMGKLLELNATRGLITSQTSELDVIMEKIATNIIEKIDRDKVNSIFEKNINDTVEHFDNQKNNTEAVKVTKDYTKYIIKTNAFNRWKLVSKLIGEFLKTNTIQDFSITDFNNYNKEVNEIRNRFAHSVVQINSKGIECLSASNPDGTPYEFTKDSCINLRKDIVKHSDNLDILLNYLEK